MTVHKAQVSVEAIVLVSLILVLMVPVLFLGMTSVTTENEKIAVAQARFALRALVEAADGVYVAGNVSNSTLMVYFPNGVDSLNVSGHELSMRMNLSYGQVDVVETSLATITDGGIRQGFGYHKFSLAYKNDAGSYIVIRDE